MKKINSARVTKDYNVVPVTVEVEITPGIGIHMIGLADEAVKESLLRVVTALQYCGYSIPGKKIVINLAPADLRKTGSGYDLPIALGILLESGQVRFNTDDFVFYGELGLDGSIRPVGDESFVWELAPRFPSAIVDYTAFRNIQELLLFATERWI